MWDAAASEKLSTAAEAGEFFATFTPEVFTALRPLDPNARYDLSELAGQPGLVLETASRDLSAYEGFDASDYETKRDAFLAQLAQQDGFVAEYQWVSVLNPNLVIGMTVYASAETFQTVATSEFAQSASYTDFVGTYPPHFGYASFDARTSS